MSTSIKQIPSQIDNALREPWQVRAMAVIDAIILNVVILAIARVVTGEYPVADTGSGEQTVSFVAVIFATTVAGLIAALLLGLLERVTSRGRQVWTGIAVFVLLLSLLGPLGGGVDTMSKIVLATLHLGAGATIIPLMRRSPAAE